MNEPRAFGLVDGALVAGVCLALFLSAWQFARTQAVWSDEVTQLAGLRLNPVDQVRYLMHDEAFHPGLPLDRMPPLSYWAGWAWSQVFGWSEMSFRMMGICAATLACAAVAVGGFVVAGRWGLVGAGLSFAISANVIEIACFIRAYPLFLAFAAIAMLGLVCFARGRERRKLWLTVMVTASLGAAYSHFFGMVLGGAVLSAAWITALRQHEPPLDIVLGGVLFLVLSAGVWPFAMVATSATNVALEGQAVTNSSPVRTLYRLVGHPAASVDLPVLGLLGLSFAALVWLALWRKRGGQSAISEAASDAVPTALAAGLGVTFLAGVAVSLFDVYRPSYSCWAIPGVHLFVALALARTCISRRGVVVARVAVVLMLVSQAWILGVLLKNAETFSYGPHAMLAGLVEEHERDIEILHEANWQVGYYPLRYEFGPDLAQWAELPVDDASRTTAEALRLRRLPSIEITDVRDLSSYQVGQKVLLVGCRPHGQADIRRHLRYEPWQPATGTVAAWLVASPEWRLIESRQHFSYISAYAIVFEKVAAESEDETTDD